MKTTPFFLAALLGAASTAALAQYTGPSGTKGATAPAAGAASALTTVRALLANGKDDAMVTLQGRIIRHLGGEKYRFADSTGEIDLEIDSDKWPANMPIDDKAEVRIHGEYDKNMLRDSDIDVERIEKVK